MKPVCPKSWQKSHAPTDFLGVAIFSTPSPFRGQPPRRYRLSPSIKLATVRSCTESVSQQILVYEQL